ncbi:F-box domain containing protein [Trema orientale]|uniref:F-box domain containing protein n=1 Tax=Trema orientale TaxID=63057 RepID=A0A2P5FXP7_TREOI|nr:F-box domain containing protein [Trema orientale]
MMIAETKDLKAMDIVDDTLGDSEEDTFDFEDSQQEMTCSPCANLKVKEDCGMLYPAIEVGQILVEYSKISKFKKHKEEMTIHDVVKELVLRFLPAKTLCRFRLVCKEWNHWITNPFLVHLHSFCFRDISGLFCQAPKGKPHFISLNPRAYGVPSPTLSFLPENVTIRAASNGLLCCQSHNIDPAYYICNPATKEWKLLRKPTYYHGPKSVVALNFEPSMLNFKANFELICAIPIPDNPVVYFEIYSSRSDSWRVADTECWEPKALEFKGDGFLLKGVAFWETCSGAVLAFDSTDEQYGMLPTPPSSESSLGVLTEMHGELCYILPHEKADEPRIDVYGGWNLSLKYKIPLDSEVPDHITGELRPLPCVDGDVLMVLLGTRLCACNVKEGKLKTIKSNVLSSGAENVKFLPYVNSLTPVGHQYVESKDFYH